MPFSPLSLHARLLLPMVHCATFLSLTLTYIPFLCNETPLHFFSCSLLSKALWDLSGATRLNDERVGHYLATRALPCALARRQFKNAIQYANAATSAVTTGRACKATVEAYAASLLPPTTMSKLLPKLRARKSSWTTLSELYTLREVEYHRSVPKIPPERPRWPLHPASLHQAGLPSPLERARCP